MPWGSIEHIWTRWGYLLEIWIAFLPQCLGYGRPYQKLGAHWPLKGWKSLYGACLDDWGSWWPPGEVIPDIKLKKTLSTTLFLVIFNSIFTAVREIWLAHLRNAPIWYSIKASNFPLAQVSYNFNIKVFTIFIAAKPHSSLFVAS